MTSVSTDRRFGVGGSLAQKAPCKVAATTNLTLSGEQTIDGQACVTGDRVLPTGQTDGIENGIWIVDTSDWQRAPDWDGARDVVEGTFVYATEGVNKGHWSVTTSNPITPGTTSVAFAFNPQLSPSSEVDTVGSISALKATTPVDGAITYVKSHTALGDGGEGHFRAITGAAAATYTDDNGLTILPTGGDGSAAWLREHNGIVSPEMYGAKGDNSTEDTVALTSMFNSGYSISMRIMAVYITDYIVVDTIDNITIYGNGATLKRLSTSTGADFIRGAVVAFGACNHIRVVGLVVDGNRGNLIVDNPSNVSMNYCLSFYGTNTIGSDTLLDTGGETKGSKNILVEHCEFYRSGSTGVGVDKFGDGVYAFGVDGLTVKDNYFEDHGRWPIAFSDCFNVRIHGNDIINATSGTYATALGSIDIENESADQTNGSYSRNIWIYNNNMVGRVSMLVQALASVANNTGANHYLRNVYIKDNVLENSQYATYGITGINILNTAYTTTYPDLSGVWVQNNKITGESSTRLDTGINISGSVTSVTMTDFFIEDNKVFGFTDGIDISSSASPTLTNVNVCKNHISSEFDSSSGKGIIVQALEMNMVNVDDNTVRDYGSFGIQMTKDGGGAASISSVSRNKVFDGLATFTGTGIRASGDYLITQDNYVTQSGGLDFDFEADDIISNATIDTKIVMTELTSLSGATATFSNVFPIGTLPLGVSTRVTTLITGATSFDIGDGTDVDRWGAAIAVAAGTTTDAKDFTVKSLTWGGASAQSVVLTANGGNFTAGAIRIVGYYLNLVPPTA